MLSINVTINSDSKHISKQKQSYGQQELFRKCISSFFISSLQLVSSFVWAIAGSGAPQSVNEKVKYRLSSFLSEMFESQITKIRRNEILIILEIIFCELWLPLHLHIIKLWQTCDHPHISVLQLNQEFQIEHYQSAIFHKYSTLTETKFVWHNLSWIPQIS